MNRKRAESVLHLSSTWARKDVRTAYKQRAKELHPDKHPDRKDMASKFVELKEAHDYLLGWNDTKDTTHPQEEMDETDKITPLDTAIEELLTKLSESYQEALIPLIQSLPAQKQKWVLEYLEMYGEVFLGKDVYSILSQIRTDPIPVRSVRSVISDRSDSSSIDLNHQEPSDSLSTYHVHFHEMLNDQIIVHNTQSTQTFIPSWCTEWKQTPITRHLPHNVSIDASNTISFHISISFHNLYHTQEDPIVLNKSYFSEDYLIHVMGHVPRNTINLTKNIQSIPESHIISIHLYNKQGTLVSTTEGVFLPDEPMDSPSKRASCTWAISLIP